MSTRSDMWRWEDVARMAGARPAAGLDPFADKIFSGLSIDSRSIQSGELFLALKGEQYDGHDFIPQSLEGGAAGILMDEQRWLSDASLRKLARERGGIWLLSNDTLHSLQLWAGALRGRLNPRTIALTGSSGKTTTKDLLAGALSCFGPVCAAQRSFNNAIGVPYTLLQLEPRHRFLISELGMNRSGEIEALVGLVKPHIALITSLGRAHVGFLGHPGAVKAAKLEIIKGLDPDGILILPDKPADLHVDAKGIWNGRMLLFGTSKNAEISLEGDPEFSEDGTRFRVSGLPEPVTVRLVGRGAVECFLAALAVCRAMELPLIQAARAMATVDSPAGRLQPVRIGGVTLFQDTYNASPESSVANLEFLLAIKGAGHRYFAFGEMGELGAYSRECHEEVGRLAARCDVSYFLGPEAIWAHREVERLGGRSRFYDSHEELAQDLVSIVKRGDLILVKGSRRSGMEKVCKLFKAGMVSPVERNAGRE
ncbi:MAG: UDP-N-acetylmuramoyl-tripeptide--D-alanyl-D-alanine ligase [Candidatus Eisenbacteria bacterium]|uniref:UDP-N-acetylmuramoyl-tripeptide--D-alanyl-D-alanine ligase n=1 Tax=Eiseniibacteriota bacterium TaxID=2212470 RepID=A0A948S0I9_UNCEI|nr:UDP-N-acetylmuramoyl-tripeptide--D-alanyl-D-alanine ligase [Candidatus Eisenbacteria bacterium]MBU1950410.1 UDP-N-acetylmuramoyl-tripeptide--D-alanyl-D-alanine ligase [Candidatus Eisenbacteria bacterium]MBU2692969.1 UDP-N-acetylmuramoyl-tripeptide--D-alanyl-D-alanine ligase [Candidatus Eisenbacteria bacterium]